MNAIKQGVATDGPSNSTSAIAASGTELPASIFHEPWWLDIATDGRWGEAVVRENGLVVGRMPYPIDSQYRMPISVLPSLIRTLGPAFASLPGKASTAFRHRLEITHGLIDQLPRFAYFDQNFDPHITDCVAFIYRGFVAGAAYCFRISPGRSTSELWSEMTDRRRRVIRRATDEFSMAQIDDVDEFCQFYERNLGSESNMHGTARMRALLVAIQQRGAGRMIGARDATNNLVAAVTLVWDSRATHYLLGTRRLEAADNGATSMLLWHGIQEASARGLIFDLDGVNSPGMLQFLAGFGGQLTQRLRLRQVNRAFRLINAVQSLVRGNPAIRSRPAA